LRPDARARVTAGIRAQLQLFEGGAAEQAKPEPAANADALPRGFSDF